jgi:hypothetical protein
MCKKVVTAQGFRLAFPDEMAGLPYIQEEVNAEEAHESKQIPDLMPKPKDAPNKPQDEKGVPVAEKEAIAQPEPPNAESTAQTVEDTTLAPIPAGYSELKAVQAGKCKGCGENYEKGARMAFSTSKGIYHPECTPVA